jgi:transposase
MELFSTVDQLVGLSPGLVLYDTTNFSTSIGEPKRSALANSCHSKDAKHHLAVEKSHGVPILSQIYQANRHDSKLFSCVLADLAIALQKMCPSQSDVVIVLDKGNNSRDNFRNINGLMSRVGSLAPSHHKELIDIALAHYDGSCKELRYYHTKKNIMGIHCAVVITFNIFSNMLASDPGYLIDTYNQRTKIESDFQLLKDETIIRFRPIRHWTDTKIGAHPLCRVLALTLIRVMQWKAQASGYPMTPHLLKDELSDIRQVVMLNDQSHARRQIP